MGFILLWFIAYPDKPFLVLILDVAGPNFRYKCTCGLDGAWGDDSSFEVLEHGGLHLVVTEVVPVGGGANKKGSGTVRYLSEGLRMVGAFVP